MSTDKNLAKYLWLAADNGNADRVKSLLNQGADPNHSLYSSEEWTGTTQGSWMRGVPPLHVACGSGNLEIVKMLVQAGANVNECEGPDNWTPIHYTCRNGRKDVLVYMVREAQCDTDAVNAKNESVLHLACQGGHKDIVQFLLKEVKCDIGLRDAKGMTPILYACWLGNIDIVKLIMEKSGGHDDSLIDGSGRTALSWASMYGRSEVVNYLKSLPQLSAWHDIVGSTEHDDNSPSTHYVQDLEAGLQGEVVNITMNKSYSSFGFVYSYPKEPGELFQITKIKPGGLFDSDGQLHIGDIFVRVNGTSVLTCSLNEFGKLLNNIPLDSEVSFEVRRGYPVGKAFLSLSSPSYEKGPNVTGVQNWYLQQLDKLMQDTTNTIDLCYLKLLLVGPPGVGKTTTLNRLLKEYTNIVQLGDKAKRQSTLLANCTQVFAFIREDESTEWLSSGTGDKDEEAILLIRYLCGEELEQEEQQADKMELDEKVVESDEVESPVKMHSVDEEPHSEKKLSQSAIPSKLNRRLPPRLLRMKEQLKKLVRDGNYTVPITHLGNTLLNINDVGGQPGFLEMLPALSTGPAIYLVFFDLSKELNQLYEITFNRDNTVIMPFPSLHTVESTISQIFSSIASSHCISRQPPMLNLKKSTSFEEKFQRFQEIQPITFLIGTHLDKVEEHEKKVKETSDSLKIVTQKFTKIVVTSPQSNSPFFMVNNWDGEEANDIAPIRTFVNEIVRTRFQRASLPVQKKWLIFNIILRREYQIVEMKECYQIGEMLDIDNEEIDFCIWYLNCIGTLMHFSDIADDWFKNHVICSPQVVFDSISQLIVTSLRTLKCGIGVTEFERKELLSKGQFSKKLIEMYCENTQATKMLEKRQLIPAEQLIMLLKHVNILSPIIHNEADGKCITYLMPAVLSCATQEELTSPPPHDANNPEPLLITFKCGYVPTGTFCGMVTQLVSCGPDEIPGFVWELVEDGVKRNLISFYVDYVNKVTLICHDRCYEIRVTRDDDTISLDDLCAHVISVILHILKKLYEKLVPQLSFRCSCPKHRTDPAISNVCTLVDIKKIRFLCDRRPVKLNEGQKSWIGDHVLSYLSRLNKKSNDFPIKIYYPVHPVQQEGITPKEVVKAAHNAQSAWFSLGIELEIDVDTLKVIQKDNHNIVGNCYLSMLKLWVERHTPSNWSALIEALESPVIGRPDIARTIKTEQNIVSIESTSETGSGGFTLKTVRRLTWEARSKWRELGIQLEIKYSTIQEIEEVNMNLINSAGDCHTDMLIHWFNSNTETSSPPSWSALVEALRSVDFLYIAQHIEDHYCNNVTHTCS